MRHADRLVGSTPYSTKSLEAARVADSLFLFPRLGPACQPRPLRSRRAVLVPPVGPVYQRATPYKIIDCFIVCPCISIAGPNPL